MVRQKLFLVLLVTMAVIWEPQTAIYGASLACEGPALSEIRYMETITRAQAGAVEWSQLAAYRAIHPELRAFARATADEQTSLNNGLVTLLSVWYDITQITVAPPAYNQTLCCLFGLRGGQFEVAYMNAMINHLQQMLALSETAAGSVEHEFLRQTALQTSALYYTKIDLLSRWLADWYGSTEQGSLAPAECPSG